MKKKKIIITTAVLLVAIFLITVVVIAGTRNSAADYLNDKIVSQREDGMALIPEGTKQEEKEDDLAAQFNRELIYKYDTALSCGYVFQYEMFMNENMVKDYRFIRAFSDEELAGASFTDDYSHIIIGGESYVIKWGYPGQFRQADDNLLELDERTVILRVFTEENWKEGSEIFAREVFEGTKKNVVIPISEGRASFFSNEDDSFIRSITDEEISNAKISENGVFVDIKGDLYIVTYLFNESVTEVLEIRLRSREGYKGDAGFLNPDNYRFFTIDEWLEE